MPKVLIVGVQPIATTYEHLFISLPIIATPEQVFSYHQPCPSCGSTSQKLGAGKGPHQGSLLCAGCDRFLKWLSKRELARIATAKGGQV